MNCSQAHHLLIETLEVSSRPALEAHLEHCDRCRGLWLELQDLEQLNRSLASQIEAPADFSFKVVSELTRARSVNWLARMALLVVGVSTLLGAVFWYEDRSTENNQFAVHERIRSGSAVGQRVEIVPQDESLLLPASESLQSTSPYVEIELDDRRGHPQLFRVPSTIEIRRTDIRREAYLTNVSH